MSRLDEVLFGLLILVLAFGVLFQVPARWLPHPADMRVRINLHPSNGACLWQNPGC